MANKRGKQQEVVLVCVYWKGRYTKILHPDTPKDRKPGEGKRYLRFTNGRAIVSQEWFEGTDDDHPGIKDHPLYGIEFAKPGELMRPAKKEAVTVVSGPISTQTVSEASSKGSVNIDPRPNLQGEQQ